MKNSDDYQQDESWDAWYSKVARGVTGGIIIFLIAFIVTVFAMDALEYELTGECQDCIIIHKINKNLE